jgi:hypothetical protein
MININQFEEFIKRNLNDTQSYSFMVIANAGTALLDRYDELNKIKKLCEEHKLWVHVTGDLLGSFTIFSTTKENVNISCGSLTIDIVKLIDITQGKIEYNSVQKERLNDDNSAQIVELNSRIRTDFMSYGLSFLQDDEEARECVKVVWNKYLQCAGDVSIISAFFS